MDSGTKQTTVTVEDATRQLTSYLDWALTSITSPKDGKAPTVPFTYADGVVIAGNHHIRIRAVADHASEEKSRFFVASRFEVIVDDAPVLPLNYWAVAVGESMQSAVKAAVQQWYMGFGQAVFDAMADQPTTIHHGNYRIYAGLTGIRGDVPEDWKIWGQDLHNRIVPFVTGSLPTSSGQFHALDIMFTIKADGAPQGQCLFDAKQSETAFSALKQLAWPKTKSTYMFKQAYVLAHRPSKVPIF